MLAAAALCLTVGAQTVTVDATAFTLAWKHTVEKIRWEEDYIVAGGWLFSVAARVRGTGAGMEPPAGATLDNGVWHYRPRDRWHRSLTLAASEFGDDYQLCIAGICRPLRSYAATDKAPVTLTACRGTGLR